MTTAAHSLFTKYLKRAGIQGGLSVMIAGLCAAFVVASPASADQAAWNTNVRFFSNNSQCMQRVRSALRSYDRNPDFWWESNDSYWMQSGDFYITTNCSGGTLHFIHIHRVGNRDQEPINVLRQITRNLN